MFTMSYLEIQRPSLHPTSHCPHSVGGPQSVLENLSGHHNQFMLGPGRRGTYLHDPLQTHMQTDVYRHVYTNEELIQTHWIQSWCIRCLTQWNKSRWYSVNGSFISLCRCSKDPTLATLLLSLELRIPVPCSIQRHKLELWVHKGIERYTKCKLEGVQLEDSEKIRVWVWNRIR